MCSTCSPLRLLISFFFFFNDTATTEIYTLSLHDALPIFALLKQEGVSVMFGNPGTTELPLMDGLAREPGIHYVLALQEAVAIAMADAYAQAAGGLGAVNEIGRASCRERV